MQKAKNCFEIKGDVVVQKYDKEWSEYIDCDSFVDIVSGDKLKIIVNQSKRSTEGQDKRLDVSAKTTDNVREAFKGQKKIKLTANGEMVLEPLQEQVKMQYCKFFLYK